MKVLFTILVGLLLAKAATADIIYVQTYPDSLPYVGPNMGTSWDKAFSDPQDAFNKSAMTPGSDVVVMAEGTYVPFHAVTNPTLTRFDLGDEVTVIGGYRVNDHWRNPTGDVYGTVLSGEIGTASHNNNCRTVLILAAASTKVSLQRLKIYGGHGGQPIEQTPSGEVIYGGAGIFFTNRSVFEFTNSRTNFSMKDVWIDNCFADHGAGMYYNASVGSNSEDETVFNMLRVKITNCWASYSAGGAYIVLEERSPDPDIEGVIQNLSISNCSTEAIAGGLVLKASGTDIDIVNSQIHDCNAAGSQGAFYLEANALLVGSNISVRFCTFYNNAANTYHTGLASTSFHAQILFDSCVLWSQGSNIELHALGFVPVQMNNCCVRGGIPWNTISGGLIFADPMLGNDMVPLEGSPLIDTGVMPVYPYDRFDLDGDLDVRDPVPYDITGNLRYHPVLPDIGAHERQ